MTKLINILFKNSNMKWLKVTKNGAHMHNKRTAGSFSKEDIIELIEFVITNSYVIFADTIFIQTTGIPMGSSPAPIIADLVLSMCEYTFLCNPDNKSLAIRLKYTKRYVDDICCIGSTALKECFAKIYPSSLPLNFDKIEDNKGHFLDLDIDMNQQVIRLYDKRRDFDFKVTQFGHRSSNQPPSIGPTVMYSQMLRVARLTTNTDDFIKESKKIIENLMNNGYEKEQLQLKCSQLFRTYVTLFYKFNFTSYKHFRDVLFN